MYLARKLLHFLLDAGLDTVIHAFVISGLDHWNVLYLGLHLKAIRRLILL